MMLLIILRVLEKPENVKAVVIASTFHLIIFLL